MNASNDQNNWLAERVKGIGGSEISAILGLNKWKTPLQVFFDKTGMSSDRPENDYIRAGNKLEKVVAEYFVEETGYTIVPDSNNHIRHKKFDFIIGTPDGIYVDRESNNGVVEYKTTQLNIDPDDLPKPWFCQLQWYMGIKELSQGEIAWLERGLTFNRVKVDFVPEFFNYMIDQAANFWENHVLKNVAPEPMNLEDVEKLYRKHTPGKTVSATLELNELFLNLKEVRKTKKLFKDNEEDLIHKIKSIMGDAELLEFSGETLCTWKNSKPTTAFSLDKFKESEPELYKKYCYEKEGVRRFLIK